MRTQRVLMKGVLHWFVRGVCRAGTRYFLFCLRPALVGSVQNIFFLTIHYFKSSVLRASQAEQAAVLVRLSLSMCLCGLWLNHILHC